MMPVSIFDVLLLQATRRSCRVWGIRLRSWWTRTTLWRWQFIVSTWSWVDTRPASGPCPKTRYSTDVSNTFTCVRRFNETSRDPVNAAVAGIDRADFHLCLCSKILQSHLQSVQYALIQNLLKHAIFTFFVSFFPFRKIEIDVITRRLG